jgi:hypothetical protein
MDKILWNSLKRSVFMYNQGRQSVFTYGLISRQINKGQKRNQYGQLILRKSGNVQTFQNDCNKSKLNSRYIKCEERLSQLKNVSSCRLL